MSTHAARPSSPPARGHSPLSWRAELGRQLRRRRTLWSFGLLLALPLIMVGAFAIGGGDGNGGGANGGFVDLATGGAANFAVFTLAVSSSFLLLVLAALMVGDSVPSEASWATLRYLLIAPVPRARLLTSKLVVGFATVAVAVVALVVWAVLVGGVFYGWASFTATSGLGLDWGVFAPRLAGAAAYVVVTLAQVGAIAFCLGVRTDAPLAAVGGAVMTTIVAAILGQIDNLGSLRSVLPLYYSDAWFGLLSPRVDVAARADLVHGVVWSVLYTVVFVGLGYHLFRRKDVLS